MKRHTRAQNQTRTVRLAAAARPPIPRRDDPGADRLKQHDRALEERLLLSNRQCANEVQSVYRSILVGQDASEESLRALEMAIWLAGVTHAHLTLVHLHGRKLPLVSPAPLQAAEALLEERSTLCRNAGVACSGQMVEGWTTHALVAETKWHDLVVVGKHGASRSQRDRGLGSLPAALLAACPVPILIADDLGALPRSLLVAFDESPDACSALRTAASLAGEKQLRLHVVEVVSRRGQKDKLARAQAYLDDCPALEAEVERLVGRSGDVLLDYIRERDIQLTFVPALDRSLMGHKLTDRIANETTSSIVVPQGRTPPIY